MWFRKKGFSKTQRKRKRYQKCGNQMTSKLFAGFWEWRVTTANSSEISHLSLAEWTRCWRKIRKIHGLINPEWVSRSFRSITQNLILSHMNNKQSIMLKTDACKEGIAGMLFQKQSEQWRLITCCSRSTNDCMVPGSAGLFQTLYRFL